MYTNMRHKFIRLALLPMVVILLCAGLIYGQAQAATLPPTPCTGTGTVTCNLWAKPGSISLPGVASATIWGYASSAAGAAGLPGPIIIVNQGDTVIVNLTNNLTETTAMLFQGQTMIPDTTGVAPGGSKSYTFVAGDPGTYLYEAGLLSNGQHQVAMGLYGALVVRPSAVPPAGYTGQAYASPDTAFHDEALVLLSEIDTALNNSPTPATFDMRKFAPKYFLINGKVSPASDAIGTAAGSALLLRYVNAGLQAHSMSLLGMRQKAIAIDGNPYQFPHNMVAETIAPGQTADTIVAIPPSAPNASKYALYDASMFLHNFRTNNTTGTFGGMLAFINVTAAPPSGDTTGPATSGFTLTPSSTNGTSPIALSASVSDASSGGSNIVAAEYHIDTTAGAGVAMTAVNPPFDSPTESVAGTISTTTLAGLSAGTHNIYVRGQDSAGNWGPFQSAQLYLDNAGPATTGLALAPDSSNGTVNVTTSATGNDSAAGNSNIVAAEYWIDAGGAQAMTVNTSAPIASLSATIPAATINALTEGVHVLSARSRDAMGNWGAAATANLVVDKTGPVSSNINASPAATNGTQGFNSSTPAVRVTAAITDTLSRVSAGEGFIDTIGANGSGIIFVASDGLFNSSSETGYADLPLVTLNSLPDGPHTFYAHGRDSAGNWSTTYGSVVVILDKSTPSVSGLTATPNPTNSGTSTNTSFVLAATATDPDPAGAAIPSGISAAEWYEGADPGIGQGNPMSGAFGGASITVSATIDFVARGWTPGNHTVFVRARDAAGNWSATGSIVVNVVLPGGIFADSFSSGNLSAWSSSTGPNLSVNSAASLNGTPAFGLQATLAGTTASYVTNLSPAAETVYHARFYFDPNTVLPNNNNTATGVTIFSGLNAANTAIFQVQFRRQSAGPGIYQVRLSVLRAGGTSVTGWAVISDAPHYIEIAWQSGASTTATLYVDGVVPVGAAPLTGLNTSANTLEAVRLGPSAGLVAGASGSMFFDAFASNRTNVIGP